METTKTFPNGFESWAETHHVIVERMTNNEHTYEVVENTKGIGGLWTLAITLTDEFELTFKDEVWGAGMDYYDTLDVFLRGKEVELNKTI